MRILIILAFVAFGCSSCAAFAQKCDTAALPDLVRRSLSNDFQGWKVVTPESLSADDRKIWVGSHSAECPGLLAGHFTGEVAGYVVSLLRGPSTTLEQQVVYFEPNPQGLRKVVLDPPSRIDIVTVLRKFAPGEYRSADREQSLMVRFDTIGVSQIEAGTVVFYWDGKTFRQIVTSE